MPDVWRKSLGERGCRVVVFERTPGGILYREVHVAGQRVAAKKSLGHRDKRRAESDGYALLARLKAQKDALDGEGLTLAALFDMYVGSPAHAAKKARTQKNDERGLRRVVDFVGGERRVASLSDSDVERFSASRSNGVRPDGKKVRTRAVAADIVALRTMLNWATRQRTHAGEFLLSVNPLRGVRVPKEKNPLRPVETFDRYLRLQEVVGDVDWRLPLALALAESTGQRIGSILGLRVEDVDLRRKPFGWIRFRSEYQKAGFEHWVPLRQDVAAMFGLHVSKLPGVEPCWLFPRERRPENRIDTALASRLLRLGYERAGIRPLRGGLWHPWRRKFATERKDMPLREVAEAGGWRDPNTLLVCYQQSDPDSLTRVVLEAPKLTAAGLLRPEVAPKVAPLTEGEAASGVLPEGVATA